MSEKRFKIGEPVKVVSIKPHVLAALKRELQDYNIHTATWKAR